MSKLFYALFLVCYISGCKSPDDVLDKVCSIPDSYFVDKCGNLNACVNWSNYKNTRRYGVGRCKTIHYYPDGSVQTECVYEMKDNETSQIRIVEYRTYGFNGELISDWGENKPEVFYKLEDDMVKKLFERSVSVCSPMSIRTPDELSAERRMIAARYFIGRTGDVHVCLWAQDGNVSDKLVVVVDVKHGQLEEIARTQYGSLLNEVSMILRNQAIVLKYSFWGRPCEAEILKLR